MQQQLDTDYKAVDKNGNTLLHLTLENEQLTPEECIKSITMLLDQGIDINSKNKNELTPLHLAIYKQIKEIINLLIQRGAQIDIIDNQGNTLAHHFIQMEIENHKKVSELPGQDLPSCIKENMEKEDANFVEWLIGKEFDFDRKNCSGESALHFAIEMNSQHNLPTLLKHSTDINFINETTKENFLHLFLKAHLSNNWLQRSTPRFTRRYSNEIVKILLDRGVSVDIVNADGKTPVDLALQLDNEIDVVEMMIGRFTNIHHTNSLGQTLLHQLISRQLLTIVNNNNYITMIHSLIAKGSDVNEKDRMGMTPIHLLAHKLENIDEWFDLLIKSGCNINATNKSGETPLHLAIKCYNESMVRKLIEHKADINCRERRQRRTPLIMAVERGLDKVVELLLGKRCDVDTVDIDGLTSMHVAVNNNNISVIQNLIAHGADLNLRENRTKMTPLLLAAKKGYENVVTILLKNGANINSKDYLDRRPLHFVIQTKNYNENFQMLLRLGAYVKGQDKKGETALFLAIKLRKYDIIEQLLEYGAEINDPCVIQESLNWRHSFSYEKIEDIMTKHWIKLDAAKLSCSMKYKSVIKFVNYHDRRRNQRLKEIETLKNTSINNHTTLYQWLHMELNVRCFYINNENLKNLIVSSQLKEKFPVYSGIILSYYRECVTRKSLLKSAKIVWLELTEIRLPDICVERILFYLSYAGLLDMAEELKEC